MVSAEKTSGRELLSIVLPAYNEEENIQPLALELRAVLPLLGRRWEVETVFVDDGSADDTRKEMLAVRALYPELGVRILALDKNHGLTAALDAGFRASRGQVVAMLDADLQMDPGDLPALLEKLDGADVAVGVRIRRQDNLVKRLSSKIANFIRNRATGEEILDTGCPLKVFRRSFLERVKLYRGLHRFLPTLLRLEGARVVQVPVSHRPRLHGRSKYGLGNRLAGPFMDLLAVRWMIRRHFTYRSEEIP